MNIRTNTAAGKAAGVFVLVACSAFLFWLLESRRSVSANNDAFLQILAAEGIRQGTGYGFMVGEQFVSIGRRPPHTRWPPGLTLIAAGLEFCRMRPLEWLSAALPWIGTMSLLLLVRLFIVGLGLRVAEATALALAVVATGSFLDWHGEVGTEAAFFALLLCTILVLARRKEKPAPWAVPLVWLLTLVRSAGIYLAAGLALLYGADEKEPFWRFLARSAVAFVLLAAPLLAFHLFFGLNEEHLHNPHTSAGEQLEGQIFLLHEVIAPHTTVMKSNRGAGLIAGGGILLAVLVFAWRARRLTGTKFNVVTIPAVMGLSYLVLLTVSAVTIGYDWASVYRVSSISLMLITMAFWAGWLTCARSARARAIVLTVATAVGVGKLAFAIQRHPNPAYQRDYRATVAAFREYVGRLGSDPIVLCAADSFERNVSHGLMYAVKHGEKLPVPVVWMAFGEGAGSTTCHTVDRKSGQWTKRDLAGGR